MMLDCSQGKVVYLVSRTDPGAIAVEVADRHGPGTVASGEVLACLEAAVAVAQHHAYVGARVRDSEFGRAVTVETGERH